MQLIDRSITIQKFIGNGLLPPHPSSKLIIRLLSKLYNDTSSSLGGAIEIRVTKDLKMIEDEGLK